MLTGSTSRAGKFGTVLVAVAVAVLSATADTHAANSKRAEAAKRLQRENKAAYEMSRAFGRTAQFVMPAIVNIMVQKKVDMGARLQMPPGIPNLPFRFPMPDPGPGSMSERR